jgi:hypothetical protein
MLQTVVDSSDQLLTLPSLFSLASIQNFCFLGLLTRSLCYNRFTPQNIDYSNVRLSLVSLEGHTKYTTECTPNGYYVIPVYDRGSYKIQIIQPKGWSFGLFICQSFLIDFFEEMIMILPLSHTTSTIRSSLLSSLNLNLEPSEALITVDADNQCNKGNDINFVITGFQLWGKVLNLLLSLPFTTQYLFHVFWSFTCSLLLNLFFFGVRACVCSKVLSDSKCKNRGLSGVKVTLSSSSSPSTTSSPLYATTTTNEEGVYLFSNVVPDTYTITAEHSSWTFIKVLLFLLFEFIMTLFCSED